jgi:chromosome condensin MukBEF MukE localization factor
MPLAGYGKESTMTKALPPLAREALPERLATVFRLLRKGRHICRDDGADYRDLAHNEEPYRVLFQGLGYTLVHHGQGFFFFEGTQNLTSQRLQSITLFMLILFQDLEDRKFQGADRAWERSLLSKVFNLDDLPHFHTSQRRSMMLSLNITKDALHEKVLQPMSRMGMLDLIGTNHFHFRSPVYRFIDLCIRFADDETGTQQTNGHAERPLSDTSGLEEGLTAEDDEPNPEEPEL